MAKKKETKLKELKLVCKCNQCTHWEIIVTPQPKHAGYSEEGFLKCMTCGAEVDIIVATTPHEGVHWEKHEKGEK